MTEPRVNVTLRLSPDAVDAVDRLAEQQQRSRSQMLRILLSTGLGVQVHNTPGASEAVAARAKRVQR